jgi:hypothetical protein
MAQHEQLAFMIDDVDLPPLRAAPVRGAVVPDGPVLEWEVIRAPEDELLDRGTWASRMGVGSEVPAFLHRRRAIEMARSATGDIGYVLRAGMTKEHIIERWIDQHGLDDDDLHYVHAELTSILQLPPSRRAIELAYDFLVLEGAVINARELCGLLGGGFELCREYLDERARRDGSFVPIRTLTGGPMRKPTETIRDVLRRLGLERLAEGTAADPRMQDVQPLSSYDCRVLMMLENESLFRAVALFLLVRITDDVHPDTLRSILTTATRLDVVLRDVNVNEAVEVTDRLTAYVSDRSILPSDTDALRAGAVYTLYQMHEVVSDWIDLLRSPKDREYFRKFLVALPRRSSRFIKLLKEMDRNRNAASLTWRKTRSDRLVAGYDMMRYMVEVRYNQVRRMHDAYSQVVAHLMSLTPEERRAALPYSFHYREVVPSLDGEPEVTQDVLLRVTSRADMLQDLAYGSGAEYLLRQRVRGAKNYDPADEDDYLLEYVSTEPAIPGAPTRPLWLIPLVRLCFFRKPLYLRAAHMRSRREALKELRLGPSAAQRAGLFLGFGPNYYNTDVYRALVHLNRVYLPIDNLFMMAQFARVSIRITTTNGARPSEVMQLQADPARWGHIFDRENRVDVTYFEAVPKARDDYAVFFIDEDTRAAVDELISYIRWRYHAFEEIPVMPPAHAIKGKRFRGGKLPDGRYILSWRGMALDHVEFTICQRLMTAGLPDMEYYDLRHAFATVARAENMPQNVLMKVMNHSRSEETDHYSDPTAAEKAAFFTTFSARRMSLPTLLDAAEVVLDDQEAESLSQIGAVGRTPGGQCLNPEPCAESTACAGCALNRNDPKFRSELLELEGDAERQLERAERAGFGRFADQARRVLADIRAALREMDNVEVAREDGANQVEITPGHKGSSAA